MDFSSLIDTAAPVSNAPTSLRSVATPSAHEQAAGKLFSPQNPLLAYALVAGLTFGLMAFSTSIRVGHTSAALKIGDA